MTKVPRDPGSFPGSTSSFSGSQPAHRHPHPQQFFAGGPDMSQSTMSYGQALNEARQMIIQQQYRIKADADKIKSQQQQIVDQSAVLVESERKLKDQSAEIQQILGDLQSAHQRITELTTAREQAEAVIDRQGQRLTAMQAAATEMEQKIAEHTA